MSIATADKRSVLDTTAIETEIAAISRLVKEIAVIVHEGRLFALIVPDLDAAKEAKIVNIENEIRWYAVELYNMDVEADAKVRGYKILNSALPRSDDGTLKRGELSALIYSDTNETMPCDDAPRGGTYDELRRYLENVTDVPVCPASHIELDLGLDSLDYVQLFTFIEESFDVKVDEALFSKMMRVGELAHYIDANMCKNEPASQPQWCDILREKSAYRLTYSYLYIALYKSLFLPLFKLYFRLSVSGTHNLAQSPCIIAPTHQSMIDGFLLASALPYGVLKKTFFLAFEVVFGSWWMRPVADNGQMILIDSNKNLKRSMLRSTVPLREGKNLVVFPEGARSRDRKLLEFKPFFAILAKELNVPIVPVVLDGSFEALPAGKLFPRPAKIVIRFLEPIYPEAKSYEELTEEVKNVLEEEMRKHPLV